MSSAKAMRKALRAKAPNLKVERELWDAGDEVVVGVDEVGRGAWAGPLSLGAAVVPRDGRVNGIRDSKMLTEAEREALFERVKGWCVAWAVGHATETECDELGMSEAQRLAARRAIEALGVRPDRVLVDGKWDFVGGGITRTIVKGDSTSLSIATASILAKVTRDRWMRTEAENFPVYDFEFNKGYPCPRHRVALQGYGPTAIHRRSWVFMDHIHWTGVQRYERPCPPDPQLSLFGDDPDHDLGHDHRWTAPAGATSAGAPELHAPRSSHMVKWDGDERAKRLKGDEVISVMRPPRGRGG